MECQTKFGLSFSSDFVVLLMLFSAKGNIEISECFCFLLFHHAFPKIHHASLYVPYVLTSLKHYPILACLKTLTIH